MISMKYIQQHSGWITVLPIIEENGRSQKLLQTLHKGMAISGHPQKSSEKIVKQRTNEWMWRNVAESCDLENTTKNAASSNTALQIINFTTRLIDVERPNDYKIHQTQCNGSADIQQQKTQRITLYKSHQCLSTVAHPGFRQGDKSLSFSFCPLPYSHFPLFPSLPILPPSLSFLSFP